MIDWQTLAIVGTVFAHTAAGTWWLSKQFEQLKAIINDECGTIREKLATHEKDDATRFATLEAHLIPRNGGHVRNR